MKITIDIRRQDKPNKSRIYIFPKESILENLENRFNRPINFYKKEVIPEVAKAIKEKLGIDSEHLKFSWSQKAGCACGCSPGFIVTGLYGKEIFVDIEE